MPTRRGPDNSVRVAINGTVTTAKPYANIFHAQLATGSAITQADLDSWTASFIAAYATDFLPHCANNTVLTNAKATFYQPGGTVLQSVQPNSSVGSAGGTQLSNQTCAIVSWLTNVYWRGGKPRSYLPGVVSSAMANDDSLTSTAQAAYAAAGASFIAAINALTHGTITGTTMGFVSFSSGNAPRTPAVFFPITGALCHPRLGSQRRRLGKWST